MHLMENITTEHRRGCEVMVGNLYNQWAIVSIFVRLKTELGNLWTQRSFYRDVVENDPGLVENITEEMITALKEG